MKREFDELQKYLYETLQVKVHFQSWQGKGNLPNFLRQSYTFQEGMILGHSCLIMMALESNCLTPANIRKHWELVSQEYSGITIYVQNAIATYDRKRLIGQKIPFMVPGRQMYLPELGIELREHFQTLRIEENQYLSPAAHTIVLSSLLGKFNDKVTVTVLAKMLGYTLMTISRAYDELSAAEIGEAQKIGKERWWTHTGTKLELWQKAKPKMRSPIKNRIWIKKTIKSYQPKILAGLSALSRYSGINPPNIPVYAIDKTKWTSWKKAGIEGSKNPQDALFELQIWHYDPELLSDDSFVDLFSLFLSLESSNDERIESALDEMMREIL